LKDYFTIEEGAKAKLKTYSIQLSIVHLLFCINEVMFYEMSMGFDREGQGKAVVR